MECIVKSPIDQKTTLTECIDTAACVTKWIRGWRKAGMLLPR
jgi:hypothetical protein